MDIVTTSLDALLHKAVNTDSQAVEAAAAEAFCMLINKEKEGPNVGARLLATKIHSKCESEAMNALILLDSTMKRCNNTFHSEIGKFRFLNEMIKLVSPKYLGSQTPLSIKQKVLQLLYIWTLDFPKETKIKEAYDMLKKQGVIKEVPLSVSADNAAVPERRVNSIIQDEEKNRLLQKLLQSKNPEDLQAANRLIKNMVKEDDKRAELKSRRVTELEAVHNNARLLSEMLDSYKPGVSSQDELELIKELHQSCERLRPNVFKLISETQQNKEMLNEVLQASDELGQVFDKFTEIIIKGNIASIESTSVSLLDLTADDTQLHAEKNDSGVTSDPRPDLDLLCGAFNSIAVPDDVLKPISTCAANGNASAADKLKALDELDALSEHLLKENLSTQRIGQFQKSAEKIPMNLLVRQTEKKQSEVIAAQGDALKLDLSLLEKQNSKTDLNDDVLVDIVEEKSDLVKTSEAQKEGEPKITPEIKLNDIHVKLEEVKPSSTPPLTVLQEKNVSVTLHFGKNSPREDVTVIVVTTISKNELPLSSFLFQAVVPKQCKMKLQQPSNTTLPSYNPFVPPSAITQILLIANPHKVDVSLKFIVSYVVDEETVTEMGEVARLPKVE